MSKSLRVLFVTLTMMFMLPSCSTSYAEAPCNCSSDFVYVYAEFDEKSGANTSVTTPRYYYYSLAKCLNKKKRRSAERLEKSQWIRENKPTYSDAEIEQFFKAVGFVSPNPVAKCLKVSPTLSI